MASRDAPIEAPAREGQVLRQKSKARKVRKPSRFHFTIYDSRPVIGHALEHGCGDPVRRVMVTGRFAILAELHRGDSSTGRDPSLIADRAWMAQWGNGCDPPLVSS